jgi:N-acyl-D-aspartate/D-glutamate deacylase
MRDLVIRGATVVDGTGAAPRTADIAVEGGTIVEVGRVDGPAHRTLDADGLLVTPGFVDVHTHFDGQATWDPHLTPSCWHGVTTALLGNCGVGFAPVERGREEWLIQLMEGVEDIPGTALAEGIQWDWESFPEYLDALDRMPRALDIGAQVPHAAVRSYVMRERLHDAATPDDLDAMREILRRSLRAGALGFSTGRTAGHTDVRGEPVPGTFAADTEIAALLDVMADEELGVLQLVPAGASGTTGLDPAGAMEPEIDWMVRYGERYRRPITFLILEHGPDSGVWRGWFDRVRAANARGADIHPQVASRCFGMLFGHQSRMNMFKFRPSYQAIADLPFEARVRALRDPAVRDRILAEHNVDGPYAPDRVSEATFENLFPLGDDLDYEPVPEASVAAIARRQGVTPWEVAYDLMLGSDGRDFLLLPLLNFGGGSYDGLHDMLVDPMTVQGLGDGGAHVRIVCDASMTTYLLTHWVRDRTRGPRLSLEWAVRRLTHDPARLYGLDDRGVLAPGLRADLNVIDFDRLRLVFPEQVHDLPANAGRLVQRSEGYVETIVGGETVVADGELTEARPGRLVRGPQRPPTRGSG